MPTRPADLIRRLPRIYTAFFSVLEPHQKLAPHFGDCKGFLRYRMGVLVPNNNEDGKCWIRINAAASDNARRDRSLIEKGERYCWENGEGVVFDDSYLHEAANDSARCASSSGSISGENCRGTSRRIQSILPLRSPQRALGEADPPERHRRRLRGERLPGSVCPGVGGSGALGDCPPGGLLRFPSSVIGCKV